MNLSEFNEITQWILGVVFTSLLPFIFKILKSKEFRVFVYQGIKNLYLAFIGKVEVTHRLFYNVNKYKILANRVVFVSDPLKTKLFHILLTTKIDTSIELIYSWLKEKNNISLLKSSRDKMGLQSSLLVLLNQIVETYELRIKENYFKLLENRELANRYFEISYTGLCTNNCEKFFETKVPCLEGCKTTIGFKEYHTKNIDFISRFIETIPECEGEKNSVLFSFFLNHIDTALYSGVYDAKKVFEYQNGRYKKT